MSMMMSTMSDYFATLASDHRWATERLLDSIKTLSGEDYSGWARMRTLHNVW